MRTDELGRGGRHAAGPVSRTEWMRGLFFVLSLVVVVALVAGAALHADAFVAWLGVVWFPSFLATYAVVMAAEVRGRPDGMSLGAAVRRAYGLWPLRFREILALAALVTGFVVLAVRLL